MEIDYGGAQINWRNTGRPVERKICPALIGTSSTGQFKGQKVLLLVENDDIAIYKMTDKLFFDTRFMGSTINKVEYTLSPKKSLTIEGLNVRYSSVVGGEPYSYSIIDLTEVNDDFPAGRTLLAKKCTIQGFLKALEGMCITRRKEEELKDFPGYISGHGPTPKNTIRPYYYPLIANGLKSIPASYINIDGIPALIVDQHGEVEVYTNGRLILSGKTSNFIVPEQEKSFLFTRYMLNDQSTGITHKITARIVRKPENLNILPSTIITVIPFKDFYDHLREQINSWTSHEEIYEHFIERLVPIAPLVFRDINKPLEQKASSAAEVAKNQNTDLVCSKCGAKHPEGTLFCNKCGTKIIKETPPTEKPLFCRKCGKKLLPDSVFCSFCGTSI